MKNQMKLITIIFSVLMLFSCKDKTDYSKIKKAPAPTATVSHKILIKEFKNTQSYTYLNVDEAGKQYWMAIPNRTVKVGDTYYYKNGTVMANFKSKQLKRTFDEVIFAETIQSNPIIDGGNPHQTDDISAIENIKIDQPKEGISLEKLFKNEKSFDKKSIIIRGKVVKTNNGIMDRNWVHIADGTNFEKKNSLTISTQEIVKVGDTVTFKGNVTLNKDFGKGYVYPILIEEGILIKK